MSSLLIQGGRLIDPANGIDDLRDLLLRDGQVEAVGQPGAFGALEVAEKLDAAGCIVAPGLIDIHVHLREPGQTYKETIATGTRAAAAGGFTSVVAMPNTIPVNDCVESLAWMLDAARGPRVRLFAMPAATIGSQGQVLSDFEALAKAGALGFTDDGKPILADHVMRAALIAAARLGLPISQHAEDPAMSHGAIMNAGPMAFRLGLRGYPAEAESRIVERDIALLREIERTEKTASAPACATCLDRPGSGGDPQRQGRGAARHLRGRPAPLRADRRGDWRVRYQLQDEPSAALRAEIARR